MTKIILLAALVFAAVILPLTISRGPNQAEMAEVSADTEQAQPKKVPRITVPSPPEPGAVAGNAPLLVDPRQEYLTTLYESTSVAERLQVAQQVADRGNEEAFRDLATFVAAAEATGDDSLLGLGGQVASILGRMYGDEIENIATEFAYSPSVLVAEAAVNAAVATELESTPQWVDSGSIQDPGDEGALEALLQQLADSDRNQVQPLLEK